MDDTSIFDALTLLLDELTFTKAPTIREKFLERIGANHQLFDFLRILSTKCAPTIFSSEHVRYLLEQLSSSTSADTQLKASFIKLLLVILNMFPSYLRGSEKKTVFGAVRGQWFIRWRGNWSFVKGSSIYFCQLQWLFHCSGEDVFGGYSFSGKTCCFCHCFVG